MHLFDGLVSTDYQDILRAAGRAIDGKGLRNVRIVEVEDGLLVQGSPSAGPAGSPPRIETITLTHADLERLLLEAYRRRKPRQILVASPHPTVERQSA